ncbi:glycosyltransferase family 2 protein [Rothia nasimurium]|uniref:glycosyltransferase family 2 protein n=1 Tax=Rothia nasimurium TaxID=85336 RepID=UPI001F1803FA|nr:glycosyltransferase family A protein [Rothia nasimurium]
MNKIDYSVIIPAHNSAKVINQQINALAPQIENNNLKGEIIIVDNNSNDNLENIIIECRRTVKFDIKLIQAYEGSGPAYARNVGAAKSVGEILLFCDSDDIVSENWLNLMYNACLKHVFVTGPTIPFVNGKFSGLGEVSKPLYAVINDQKIITSSGGNFAIGKDHWESLGGMREDLKTAEDQEIAIRSYIQGTPVHFVKDASIFYRQSDNFFVGVKKYFGYGVGVASLRHIFREQGMIQQSWKGALKNFLMSLMDCLKQRNLEMIKESIKNSSYFLGIFLKTVDFGNSSQ